VHTHFSHQHGVEGRPWFFGILMGGTVDVTEADHGIQESQEIIFPAVYERPPAE